MRNIERMRDSILSALDQLENSLATNIHRKCAAILFELTEIDNVVNSLESFGLRVSKMSGEILESNFGRNQNAAKSRVILPMFFTPSR